jgi:YHS domain-containing protein
MRHILTVVLTASLMVLLARISEASSREMPGSPRANSASSLKYGGQKTCPVTGEALESMGTPIPVTVKGQTIYVCCKSCVAKVQRDPDKYLRKVKAERGQ